MGQLGGSLTNATIPWGLPLAVQPAHFSHQPQREITFMGFVCITFLLSKCPSTFLDFWNLALDKTKHLGKMWPCAFCTSSYTI